ncbi:MAG: 3-oxoacyl-ACP reductase family protein [Candidatus Altiarchaeota archaeon]
MANQNQTALVTGGGRGLGKAIALHLAELGFNIVVNHSCEKSRGNAEEVVAEIMKRGFDALAIQADVSDSAEVESMFDEVKKRFGSINILVNNAGVYPFKPGTPTHELPEEEWRKVVDVNLTGSFLCAKAAAKMMIDNGVKGYIVNISSMAGLDASHAGSHYGASKAGVISLTKTLAVELGVKGIKVNCVAPGPVPETDLLKDLSKEKLDKLRDKAALKEFATADDIAKAVGFFVSSDHITGQTLLVDGGIIRH